MIVRSIDEYVKISEDELAAIVDAKLVPKQLYYHCCAGGIIYADKDYSEKLIDVLALTGEHYLSRPFNQYDITSGICPECYDTIRKK